MDFANPANKMPTGPAPDGSELAMFTMADELLRACRAAAGHGADFPAVWGSVLRGHHFVAGLPVQRIVAGAPVLQVPLRSGEAILVGPGRAEYRLSR
jgi:hypothetical protein